VIAITGSTPLVARAPQSPGEEIANSVTHGCGLVAALAGAPVLITAAAQRDAWHVVGTAVFAATLILLYAVSTVYHALPPSRGKRIMRLVDHAAIYVLIAGTYTPFTIGVLRGGWGWALFGIIWTLAIAGVAFKSTVGVRFGRVSTVFYLLMGWVCLIAIQPLVAALPTGVVAWLVAGGLLYSGGVSFYAARRLPYAHTVWHLFVLAGSGCHFVGVLSTVS
jgi:hemolysin III